jgi:hypothetical protein
LSSLRLVLLLRLIKRSLLLLRSILVELHILRIVVALLKVLKSTLPDTTESRSRVLSDAGPGRLSTEKLDTSSLGRKVVAESTSGTGDTAELADVLESVVTEDVLGDDRAAIEDHDGLALVAATVCDDGGLGEDVLLELVAPAIIDSNLDLLHDEHNGADIAVLVLHVALAEKVVQVVVEAVVDLVDDKDFLNLLDDLLAAAIVDDLEVLLLDLDDLFLLVEVVEAVDEVECTVVCVEAVDDGVEVELSLGIAGSVDGLCCCE